MDISQLLEPPPSASCENHHTEQNELSHIKAESSAEEQSMANMVKEAGLREEDWKLCETPVGIVYSCIITKYHERILREALRQAVRMNLNFDCCN